MDKKYLVINTVAFLMLLVLIASIAIVGDGEIRRAEEAMLAKDYSSAFEHYRQAWKLFPWRTDLMEKTGIAAGYQGDYEEAIDHLKRVPDLSEQGWVILGYSYYSTGDLESAKATYRNGLEKFDSPAIYAGLRQIYSDQKNWTAEQDVLENQLRLGSRDAFVHYRLGLLLMITQSDKALEQLNLATSLDPRYETAVETLRAAIKESANAKDRSVKLLLIGRSMGLLQEWDLAYSAFDQAVEENQESADAWAWLGEAKQQTGQDGLEELNHALRLDQQSATVRGLRGLYWGRRKRYSQMLTEYLIAAKLEPQNPAWQVSIGDAYLSLGDLIQAFDAYQKSTLLGPNDARMWRSLAYFCANNGVHLEDAGLPAAKKAVDLAPSDPASLDVLGFTYFSSGRFANAQEILMRSIEIDPQYLPARIHLAMNHLAQGNFPAAYDQLIHVRDADLTGADGQTARQLLARYFP